MRKGDGHVKVYLNGDVALKGTKETVGDFLKDCVFLGTYNVDDKVPISTASGLVDFYTLKKKFIVNDVLHFVVEL